MSCGDPSSISTVDNPCTKYGMVDVLVHVEVVLALMVQVAVVLLEVVVLHRLGQVVLVLLVVADLHAPASVGRRSCQSMSSLS